jgi:hypothetical protein
LRVARVRARTIDLCLVHLGGDLLQAHALHIEGHLERSVRDESRLIDQLALEDLGLLPRSVVGHVSRGGERIAEAGGSQPIGSENPSYRY